MRACPVWLCDVISVTSAICPRCRSSGAARLVATTSGLAPGNCAVTEIVGKSTCGSGETGKASYPSNPPSAIAMVRSVVATGRAINGAEMFMGRRALTSLGRRGARRGARAAAKKGRAEAVDRQVNDRRRVERQELTEQQSADDADAERPAQLRSGSLPEHQRQRGEQRRHRRHQDRPEPQETRLMNRFARTPAFDALRLERA